MYEPVDSTSGLKPRLRAVIRPLFFAFWQALTSVRDLLTGRQAQTTAEFRSSLQRIEAYQHASHQHELQVIVQLQQALADLGRCEQVRTFMDWIDQAPTPNGPLVSVILPTCCAA